MKIDFTDSRTDSSHCIRLLQTMLNNTTSTDLMDDSVGAIIYIIVVLVWYSSSIVFLMAMQIGRSNERLDDAFSGPSRLFVQNLHDHSKNTEVLSRMTIQF